MSASPAELMFTALEALANFNEGHKPALADIQTLQAAFPALADLPTDDLCCQVIQELSGQVFGAGKDKPLDTPKLISQLQSELEQLDGEIRTLERQDNTEGEESARKVKQAGLQERGGK